MRNSKTEKETENANVLLRWMKPYDIEKELGFTQANQATMRSKRRIPFCKLGGYVLYDRRKIDKWIEAHEIEVAV